jgi:hypothetical protein
MSPSAEHRIALVNAFALLVMRSTAARACRMWIGSQPAPAGADIDKQGCQGLSNLRGDRSRPPEFVDELGHVEDRQLKLLLSCLYQLVCFVFRHIRQ